MHFNFKKISSVLEYSAWILKKYNDQQQAQQNIYRIAEIRQPSIGQYKLAIQVIGKSTVIECTPQEVVINDQMLEGFSKQEIRTITYLACEQNNTPKYKIIMQEFCDTFSKILFKLKKHGSNKIILKTASQISLDKNLINNLSREDVCSISYVAGYEQSTQESACISAVKKVETAKNDDNYK